MKQNPAFKFLRTPLSTPLRAISIVLVCSSFLLSACSTTPVEKSSAEKTSILQSQDKRFQMGKELYLNQQYGMAANVLLPLAQQGHLESQYTMGYMYHRGLGVPRNEKESTRWITMAAARGHEKAKEALSLINASHDIQKPLP